MSIKATKRGVTKEFSDYQWGMMPKHKNGWVIKPKELKELTEVKADVEVNNEDVEGQVFVNKTSKDLTAAEAVKTIKSLELDSIDDFIKDDDRASVIKAAKKRKDEN